MAKKRTTRDPARQAVEHRGRTPIRFECREVLADAYLPVATQAAARRAKMHRHTVAIFEDAPAAPLCKRVQADSLADAGSLSREDREGPPTCPACLAALRRLAADAVRGRR